MIVDPPWHPLVLRIANLAVFSISHYVTLAGLALLSYGIGLKLTGRCRFRSGWEAAAFSTSLGLGTIALGVFALGLLHWLYPRVVLGCLALAAAVCASTWKSEWEKLARASGRIRDRKVWLLGGIGVICLLPLLILPLYPPTAWDATEYHLTVAKIYSQHHAVIFAPYVRFPVFPQLNEMLFTLMLMLHDDIAAQMVQFLMMALVAVTLYAWGRELSSPRLGFWAAAIWLANPLVLWTGSAAYVDVGLALFATVAVYAFWNWLHLRSGHWLILAAVFAGFAAGSKLSGLFFLGLLGALTVYPSIRARTYAAIFLYFAVAAAVAGPWYLRSLYYTGNPVFPFFPKVFGYSFWSPEDVNVWLYDLQRGHGGIGRSVSAFLSLPWHLAFNQNVFNPEEGLYLAPLNRRFILLLPVLALFCFKNARTIRLFGFAAAYVVFWFFTSQEMRYLIPIAPIVSLASADGLERISFRVPGLRRWAGRAIVTGLGVAVLLSPGWVYGARGIRQEGLFPVTRDQRDQYLARHLPTYPAYQVLNNLKGRNYTVYVLFDEKMGYYSSGIFMGDLFGPARYSRVLRHLADSRRLYAELRSLGADYFLAAVEDRPIRLPADEFFHRHFVPIFARPEVLLFELAEQSP